MEPLAITIKLMHVIQSDVVDKIEKVETINLGGHADVPGEAVIINKASIQN